MAGKKVYQKIVRQLGKGVAAKELAKGFLYGDLGGPNSWDGVRLDSLALLYRAENYLTEKKVYKKLDNLINNDRNADLEWKNKFKEFHYRFLRDYVMPHARRQDAEISRLINNPR
jgi:hypothetical protein